MAKYKIGWLPGDGVGKDVMEAAGIVLDKLKLDAEFLPGEVGWHFWCTEGNALPERTITMLQRTDACLLGAITSKPQEDAARELSPELQDKGLIYQSPVLELRQGASRQSLELSSGYRHRCFSRKHRMLVRRR